MQEHTLAFLRELERADDAAGAVLTELDELAREVERIRERAVELEAFRIRLPADRKRLAQAQADAERTAGEAREALALAEKELEDAKGDDRIAAARRFHVRAEGRVSAAERRVQEAAGATVALKNEAAAAEREAAALDEQARELAGALHDRPRLAREAGEPPAPGLAAVSEWGSRARAALFVARGSLTSEREAVIRQANELGSLVLGEPLSAVGAALVARRVEEALKPK